jgi:F0F1-type ATP synthase assembly protein I
MDTIEASRAYEIEEGKKRQAEWDLNHPKEVKKREKEHEKWKWELEHPKEYTRNITIKIIIGITLGALLGGVIGRFAIRLAVAHLPDFINNHPFYTIWISATVFGVLGEVKKGNLGGSIGCICGPIIAFILVGLIGAMSIGSSNIIGIVLGALVGGILGWRICNGG